MDADRLPITTLDHQDQDRIESAFDTTKDDYKLGDEKNAAVYQQATLDIESVDEGYVKGDPLTLDESIPEEPTQVTLRAILVGCLLGAVVQASNLYLGLKTGFTFGPQLLGGIGGFLILKPLSRIIPKFLPAWFGVGYFGPRENVTVQSAATASGGLGTIFVCGFPALYQLGLMGAKPQDDIGKLIGFTMGAAFYGMTFAVPLRTFFILRQRLTFPTPTATAYAIKSLHASGTGAADAKQKGRWIFWSFLICFIQKVASTYVPGILYDWHFFNWIAVWGAPKAQYIDNWGWIFEITPAFFGAGILSGPNASFSFYGGSILSWAIIGPALVATGRAVGRVVLDENDQPYDIPFRNYQAMSPKHPSSTQTSPRYNLIWIGVLMMLVSAFVELAVEWRTIAAGFTPIVLDIRNRIRVRRGKDPIEGTHVEVKDPAPKRDQVPWWIYVPITLIAIAITLISQGVNYKVNVGISILSVILAFIFSFIGVLCSGVTDINPLGTVAKASQLIIGAATHGKYPQYVNPVTHINDHAIKINILAGMVGAGAASQATDLTGDLKTGHLIGAKPIAQYIAQLIGAFLSVFLCVAFFILFTTASPCILQITDKCEYSVPAAASWRSVAIAITATEGLPVPTTSGILAIVFSVVSAIIIVFRAWYCPAKYKHWVPNPSAVGLAMVTPQTQYGTAMCVGCIIALIWEKRNPAKFEAVGYAFAAGMITGEGLGGVMQAILTVAGAGPEKGVSTGCPAIGC